MRAISTCCILALSALYTGCKHSAAEEVPRVQDSRDLSWAGELRVQENDTVITVDPYVTVDPLGGYLVADAREAQVRRYSVDGELLSYFGRKGNGPQEFRRPARVHRLPSGALLVLDTSGKLTMAEAGASRVIDTQRTPFVPLYDGVPLSNDLVAVSGRTEVQERTNLVHVWNTATQDLVASFFPVPPHPERFASTYAYAGYASVAARGDSIAVLFALSDTVEIFSSRGRLLKKVPVPFPSFRPVRTPVPMSNDPVAMQEWQEATSISSSLFWAGDGTLIAQAYDVVRGEYQWSLAGFRTDGTVRIQLRDSPKLLAVSTHGNALVFDDPTAEEPNEWLLATLIP